MHELENEVNLSLTSNLWHLPRPLEPIVSWLNALLDGKWPILVALLDDEPVGWICFNSGSPCGAGEGFALYVADT